MINSPTDPPVALSAALDDLALAMAVVRSAIDLDHPLPADQTAQAALLAEAVSAMLFALPWGGWPRISAVA